MWHNIRSGICLNNSFEVQIFLVEFYNEREHVLNTNYKVRMRA